MRLRIFRCEPFAVEAVPVERPEAIDDAEDEDEVDEESKRPKKPGSTFSSMIC